ncbi:component of gems protein 1 [Microplitis demolitor]|uniref:component of gems protein 1 n=1 Tax=Microplitis demolitor TaxID=69319 RepID=UPI0006D4D82A|nr:component of gems protein 1 [Microplitis demolitor]
MKIIIKFNWILIGLFLTTIVNAMKNTNNYNNKEEESLNMIDGDSIKLLGLKRPFCNAFTGCGKKRNYNEPKEVYGGEDDINNNNDNNDSINDSIVKIPLKLYKVLINSFNRKIHQIVQHKQALNNNLITTKQNNNVNDEDYYFSSLQKQPIQKHYNL